MQLHDIAMALAGGSLGELLLGRPVDDERRALGEKEAVQEEVVPPRSRGARCRGLSKSSARATPQHSVGGAHVVVEGGDVLKKSASPIMRGHRAHAGTRR